MTFLFVPVAPVVFRLQVGAILLCGVCRAQSVGSVACDGAVGDSEAG